MVLWKGYTLGNDDKSDQPLKALNRPACCVLARHTSPPGVLRRPVELVAWLLLGLLLAPVWGSAQELTTEDPIAQALALVQAGRYGEAIPHFERALEAAEKTSGVKPGVLAILSNELAVAYYQVGQLSQAEVLYGQAIKVQEQAEPPDGPRLATFLNNLAALYHRQRRYEEAEPLYRRSRALREEELGSEHPDVAFSLKEMAMLYHNMNRLEEAIGLYERSLRIEEKQLGSENPALASRLTNLGMLYRRLGQLELAERALRRAQGIHEKTLGPDHPEVAASINNLAVFLSEQERFAEAEPLYRRVLDIQTRAFGAEHISIAMGLRNLASLYERQGLLDKARTAAQRAASILGANCNPAVDDGPERQKVCQQAILLNRPLFEKLGIEQAAGSAIVTAERSGPPPVAPPAMEESGESPQLPFPPTAPPAQAKVSPATSASPSTQKVHSNTVYRAQVRSSKLRAEADEELTAMQNNHPDLLRDLPARVVRADLGERGVWYRVQFGEFTDPSIGRHLCKQLEERGLSCWVVKTS